MSDDSYTSSDEEVSYPPSMQPEPPFEPVGRSKVQELIDDNLTLRSQMRDTVIEMERKRTELEDFYVQVKQAAQIMIRTNNEHQATISAQRKEITHLKAEKFKLHMSLNERTAANANVNDPSDTNGEVDSSLENDYKDTVNDLQRDLQEAQEKLRDMERDKLTSEGERQDQIAEFQKRWEDREIKVQEIFQEIQVARAKEAEEIKLRKLESEQNESLLQGQVKSLIAELQADRRGLADVEKRADNLLKSFQEKESQNFMLQKEVENMKIMMKNLSDDLVRHKQELEDVRFQKIEKEKSLDQLFEVYNKEREERQRMEHALGTGMPQNMAKYDEVYAQLVCAEESIKKKNDEILKLSRTMDEDKNESSTQIMIYKQQAEIFKKDFEMERSERQKQHSECENLKTTVGQYQMEMQRMKQDLMRYQAQQLQTARQPSNY